MINIHTILKKKTELLCKGVCLDETLKNHYKEQGIEIQGRKGGAGPLGGRYFLLEDNKTLVNVALWDTRKNTNLVLREKVGNSFKVYDAREKGHFCNLKLIDHPKFYDLKTTDGILMKKIALVHGINCLASTIYQKCKYWACGESCKFCGIELSLHDGSTILEKNSTQMNEVIIAAKKENKCKHMTLTSGTTEDDDKGANKYIKLLKEIKEVHPKLPIHIQIEPVEDLTYINKLKEVGASTIGIHIEVMGDILRKIITPGKAKIPYSLFEDNWKHSIEVFGKNQVSTYILAGFGESRYDIIADVKKIISLGVIPYITPVRPLPDEASGNMPIMNYNALLEIYSNVAKQMKEFGVNPFENKAGCVRCGGCSAINEAYRAV